MVFLWYFVKSSTKVVTEKKDFLLTYFYSNILAKRERNTSSVQLSRSSQTLSQ